MTDSAEKDAANVTPPCGSVGCPRPGYIKSEQFGAYLRPAHALVGPTRVTPPDVLRCNAEGIKHGPHIWDFGSGVNYQCAGCCDGTECDCVTPPRVSLRDALADVHRHFCVPDQHDASCVALRAALGDRA